MSDRTTTAAPRIADRYGRAPQAVRRGRVRIAIVIAALVAAAVAWSVWTGIGGTTTTLDTSTSAFTVRGSQSVTVQWVVSGRADDRLVCAIEAQASDDSVVGLVEVVVPPTGKVDRSGFTVVRTVRAADSGLIQGCRGA